MALKPLSIKLLKEFAGQYHIEYPLLLAIGKQESNLTHLVNDDIIQRFEKHIYRAFLDVKLNKTEKHRFLPSLDPEWIKSHTDFQLKLMSTSYGIFQIMGWYYKELSYPSIETMLEDWWMVEEIHVKDFCLFCVIYYSGEFLEALQRKDFKKIAFLYNGANYKKNNYDVKLYNHYLKFCKLSENGNGKN